jgi:SPP1 family predicted phage head-tail adaptor
MIRSGDYRHRIHIQAPVDTQNPVTGVIARDWETAIGNVPAKVMTGPGRETHSAGTKLAETAARINCRWFPGLSHEMRILWEGRIFDIISIETDLTDRREYRLRCKDGLTDGS